MENPETQLVRLDYARMPPRRRKWIRRSVLLVCLAMVVAAGWRWGPQAWRRAQLLYWQRQCLRYSAPADQVVYTTDVAIAVGLLKRADYGKGEAFSMGTVGADRVFRSGLRPRDTIT